MKPSTGIEVRGRVQELKHAEKKSLRDYSYRYFRINEMGGIEVLSSAIFS